MKTEKKYLLIATDLKGKKTTLSTHNSYTYVITKAEKFIQTAAFYDNYKRLTVVINPNFKTL
jgi:hypothetical protein